MPSSSYVICATPRSGSTMLCDLLAGTGVAGRPHSFYRRQDIDYWADEWGLSLGAGDEAYRERAFLAAVRENGSSPNGVFGIRVMFGTLPEMLARLEVLFPDGTALQTLEKAFGPTLFIHLSRQDKVAQAVSRLRAEQSGLWHRNADGSERERAGPGQAPRYDGDQLHAFLKEAEHDDAEWNGFFGEHDIQPLTLSYESFTTDPRPDLRRILEALGQNPARADSVPVRTAKLADAINAEWIARFRAESG